VKIRTGWDKQSIVARELAIGLEKAGASAIAVHGRTRSQMYQGDIDLDLIKLVKDSVSIPVIGNGNIFCAQDALDMLKYTGCDAIMLARGVLGNPWLIKEILVAIENGNADYTFARNERFAWALTHAERLVALKGEDVAMREMRSHASWYVSGMPSSHKVKNLFSQMTTYQQFVNIIENYQKEIEDLI
jgi:nifR3 family TIM-barrel protein